MTTAHTEEQAQVKMTTAHIEVFSGVGPTSTTHVPKKTRVQLLRNIGAQTSEEGEEDPTAMANFVRPEPRDQPQPRLFFAKS